jgi:hypothetical protein
MKKPDAKKLKVLAPEALRMVTGGSQKEQFPPGQQPQKGTPGWFPPGLHPGNA